MRQQQTLARRVAGVIMTSVAAAISVCATTIAIEHSTVEAVSSTDILGPAGSGIFGASVLVLPNGNFVVTDPSFDMPPKTDVGAVYLYNGSNHQLIRSFTGTNTGDRVGSGGLTEVGSSNFVVSSPHWTNDMGAVTWVDGQLGLGGAVTAVNSLTGVMSGDEVGSSGVQRLTSGHYVVRSPHWHFFATPGAGAVTWGNGTFGTAGQVGVGNSIVGSSAVDSVGDHAVVALSDGDYVVPSPEWNYSIIAQGSGAVTWGNGVGGSHFVVSSANSLVGTTMNDHVGGNGVVALTNGNYVVSSPLWDSPSWSDVGAATLGMGDGSTFGFVTSTNSWLGSVQDDQVSSAGVTPLTNGNFVVASQMWDSNTHVDAGAVTWADGDGGLMGQVTSSNSLIGSHDSDYVGVNGSVALANGNYVVLSSLWNGAGTDRGAVTWGNGATGTKGIVDGAVNSVIGTQDGDQVGTSAEPLTNGNYVITSPHWHFAGNATAGAAKCQCGDVMT